MALLDFELGGKSRLVLLLLTSQTHITTGHKSSRRNVYVSGAGKGGLWVSPGAQGGLLHSKASAVQARVGWKGPQGRE